MQRRRQSSAKHVVALCSALLAAGCAGSNPPTAHVSAPGVRYVAMGSSFAAGPGVASSADVPPNRCARSTDNYPHLLARRLRLQLTDVSCSGATTDHVLGPWNELPPQLDALTSDTGLVTITIGGNNVGYIGTLGSASCRSFTVPPPGAPGGKCPEPPRVSEADWTKLDVSLRQIIAEVRRRAPKARLIFVDYLSVLPAVGRCAATPMSAEQADAGRAIAKRLAWITRRAATQGGAEILPASDLSRERDACSAQPWVSGFPLPGSAFFVPYHPNAQGMAAIVDLLAERIGRWGSTASR